METQNENRLAKLEPAEEWDHSLTPEYTVEETPDAFTVTASLPGVSKELLETIVEGDKLVIQGRKTWQAPAEAVLLHQEIPFGNYHLTLRLDHRVNRDAVKAELNQGVLKLTLPKSEAVKPRRIKISS